MQFVPMFGNFAFTIVAFVVALSVIVAVHEYGHYIVGRWCGIKAEVFSLGFGPVIYSRVDKRGTRWQVALLPFGGYVKFLGDADAASGKDAAAIGALSQTDRRRSMHAAPLWARASTVAAGPVFNFILSFILFGGMLLARGVAVDPLTIAEMRPMPASFVQELQPGDQIIGINGTPAPKLEEFGDFIGDLPVQPVLDYTVLRDGQEKTVRGPYPFPPLIAGLQPQSAAMEIKLQVGDVITAVDGTPIFAFSQLQTSVAESDGRVLMLTVDRNGETLDFALAPRRVDQPNADGTFQERWMFGVEGGLMFDAKTETPSVWQAAQGAVMQTYLIVRSSISGLYHMITGAISSCNLTGPIGIAQASGDMASQGAGSFIRFVALLSTAVGLLNLFPIPVLDGGHLVFHAYEAVAGKPPSDGALRVLMGAGLALLLSLMLFAVSNDLFLCP